MNMVAHNHKSRYLRIGLPNRLNHSPSNTPFLQPSRTNQSSIQLPIPTNKILSRFSSAIHRQTPVQPKGNKQPLTLRMPMRQAAAIIFHLVWGQAKACPTQSFVQLWAVILLLSLPLLALDGTVTNATTNTPQPNITVTLVRPSQAGMQTIATTKSDASGKFIFDKPPQGPQLIQVLYNGVTYNKIVMPGAPATNLAVNIYESTNKRGTAQVTQHMILVQPSPENVSVNESLLLQDDSKYTYNDPANGTVQFYLPPEAKGQVKVTINAPGGMPIQRPAEETKQKNVYKIDYPIRPGETRIDYGYSVPATKPMTLAGKVLHKEGKARMVAPQGVTLVSDDIKSIGQEPTTQANIYDVNAGTYKVEIQGAGSLQRPEEQTDEDNGQPQIQQIQPRIYDHMYWLLGLTLAILGLGSYLLSRNAPAK